MCIIAICQGNYLKEEEIQKMWHSNNHGAGIVWWNGGLKMKKGFMKLKKLLNFYSSIKFCTHIIHFRSATSGSIIPSLTHPFLVKTSRGPAYLFHNGIWSDYIRFQNFLILKGVIKENEDVSDTLVLSRVLSEIYDVEKICRFLEKLEGSKFVLALKDEYIKIGDFQKLRDGIEVSNNAWNYQKDLDFWGNYYKSLRRDWYFRNRWMI